MIKFQKIILLVIILVSTINLTRAQNQHKTTIIPSPKAAKDTVWFMNGEKLGVTIIDTSFIDGVKFQSEKNDKQMIIDPDRLFSVRFARGFEKIIYTQDTAIGNDYNVNDTRYFILGEQDANKGYKAKGSFFGGIFLGGIAACFLPMPALLGSGLGVSLAPIPAFVFTGFQLLPKIKIKRATVSNEEYLNHETYVIGYERNARKIKTINSLYGGVIGLATGFIIYSILPHTQQ